MKQNTAIIMVGPDPDGLGGISRVVKTWQSAGFFADHHVHYIASVTDRPTNHKLFLLKALFFFILYQIKTSATVYIHTSSHHSFYRKSLFLLIAILFRRKIILHIHPAHFIDFLNGLSGMTRWYMYGLLKRVDAVVALTDGIKQKIASFAPQARLVTLNNPVDVKALANKNGYHRFSNRLLYLGWYIKAKGVYELVDAVDILVRQGESIHLDFFGTKEASNLREYVQKKKLQDVITVHDWIEDEDKIKVLRESTMLILPSHSEGVPNVILEAMATHTPIIATPVGGMQELLEDERNCLLSKVNDPKDLSEKISRLFYDQELRLRLAARAYDEACNQYDILVVRTKLTDIVRTFQK